MTDVLAQGVDGSAIARLLTDARKRTLDLTSDLDDQEMIGPRLAIVNPPICEIGHIAWFQEFWTLRHVRGERPLASRARRLAYMRAVVERVCDSLARGKPTPEEIYFHLVVLFHEDMRDE